MLSNASSVRSVTYHGSLSPLEALTLYQDKEITSEHFDTLVEKISGQWSEKIIQILANGYTQFTVDRLVQNEGPIYENRFKFGRETLVWKAVKAHWQTYQPNLHIPVEMWTKIFHFLPAKALKEARVVCRDFKAVSERALSLRSFYTPQSDLGLNSLFSKELSSTISPFLQQPTKCYFDKNVLIQQVSGKGPLNALGFNLFAVKQEHEILIIDSLGVLQCHLCLPNDCVEAFLVSIFLGKDQQSVVSVFENRQLAIWNISRLKIATNRRNGLDPLPKEIEPSKVFTAAHSGSIRLSHDKQLIAIYQNKRRAKPLSVQTLNVAGEVIGAFNDPDISSIGIGFDKENRLVILDHTRTVWVFNALGEEISHIKLPYGWSRNIQFKVLHGHKTAKYCLYCREKGNLSYWNADGEKLSQIKLEATQVVAISSNGQWLALCVSDGETQNVQVYKEDGSLIFAKSLQTTHAPITLKFDDENKLIVSSQQGHRLQIWDLSF